MTIWKYIEILKKPDRTLFLSKDNTKEKVAALDQIAQYGYSSDISNLIFALKNKNKAIREATCNAIIHLFKKIKNKKEYYNILKCCEISIKDIDFYTDKFVSEQLAYLLVIGSMNHNGYVRERSVMGLAKVSNEKAIQFIIYRLADWVQPVREAAKKALLQYKTKEHLDFLIENLPTIEWLQKVERINLENVYNSFIEFIISTNRDYTIANYTKYSDKLRLIIAKHISCSLDDISELKILLYDRHFLIRSLALNHLDRLQENDINLLLNDKSAKIRLNTLYSLKDRECFVEIVSDFIADESSSIRHLARFTLKNTISDFAELYSLQLKNNKNIVGSLLGLGEINARQYSAIVESYLSSSRIKIKKAALTALIKLDENSANKYVIENLDTTVVGLRRIMIDFLSVNYNRDVLEKASRCYQEGNEELKISMLNLFSKIGGWEALADLILGTIDPNDNVRNIAEQHIDRWRVRATSLYATPSNEDLERIRTAFSVANNILQNKQFFAQNPLEGLDFYFR